MGTQSAMAGTGAFCGAIRLVLCALVLAMPTLSSADGNVETGVSAGGHLFSDSTELGAADEATQPTLKTSFLIGLRVAVSLVPRVAVEGEAVLIPAKSDPTGESATVLGFRGHLKIDLLTGAVRPFLVAGYGGLSIRTSAKGFENDSDEAIHWGGGFSYAITPSLLIRIDARHLIVPDRTANGATSDFEVSSGIAWRFGAKSKIAPPPPSFISVTKPPALNPKAGDSDGDGVNDEDDRCSGQAEDPDGFQDRDGCADLDNDGDGIVDTADQCPDEAETKNGHLDDDGCPDQATTDLIGFTFPRNSDKFDPASAALLERAYQVLERNPRLNVEISGHTSEGESKPLELSIARAEAAKEYLVRRGIDEERLRTVGYGNDRPLATNTTREGRDKNRRIEFRVIRPEEMNP